MFFITECNFSPDISNNIKGAFYIVCINLLLGRDPY